MDWQQYEEVTKYIYETIGRESGLKILGHGMDCKVDGNSGVKHQIDVLASHTNGIHTYKTAIECKYWSKKVNKDIVAKISMIIEDASIEKGVIVSKLGFTDEAIKTATSCNVGLVELREIKEDERPNPLKISSWIHRPEIKEIVIIQPKSVKCEQQEEIKTDSMIIRGPYGQELSMQKIVDEFNRELRSGPINKEVELKWPFFNSKLINTITRKEVPIEGMYLKGILVEIKDPIKFHSVDDVWLIMKVLFEETTYTISTTGKIKKT